MQPEPPSTRPPPESISTRLGLLWFALVVDLVAVSPPGYGTPLDTYPQGRILLHILAAVLAGLSFPAPKGSGAERPAIGGLMCALACCFPVLGICAAVAIAVNSGRRAEHEREMLAEYRELVDVVTLEEEMPEDARPHFWAATWRALELTNFDAIVEEHSDSGVIASAFESAQKLDLDVACAFYRKALGSHTAVTRYYASTSLSRAEEKCDKLLHAAEAAYKERPDDPEMLLEMGDARLAYAIIGDPVDPVTLFHIQEAAKVFRAALEKLPAGHPRYGACQLSLARALLASNDPAGAAPHFQALLAAGSREVTVIVGAAEACHGVHDYHGLLRTLKLGLERNPDAPVLRRLYAEWAEAEAA